MENVKFEPVNRGVRRIVQKTKTVYEARITLNTESKKRKYSLGRYWSEEIATKVFNKAAVLRSKMTGDELMDALKKLKKEYKIYTTVYERDDSDFAQEMNKEDTEEQKNISIEQKFKPQYITVSKGIMCIKQKTGDVYVARISMDNKGKRIHVNLGRFKDEKTAKSARDKAVILRSRLKDDELAEALEILKTDPDAYIVNGSGLRKKRITVCKGVYCDQISDNYYAVITAMIDGVRKHYHLGTYDDIEKAKSVYAKADGLKALYTGVELDEAIRALTEPKTDIKKDMENLYPYVIYNRGMYEVRYSGKNKVIIIGRYNELRDANAIAQEVDELCKTLQGDELETALVALKKKIKLERTIKNHIAKKNECANNAKNDIQPYKYITSYPRKNGYKYIVQVWIGANDRKPANINIAGFDDISKAKYVAEQVMLLKQYKRGNELADALLKMKEDIKNGTFEYKEPQNIFQKKVDSTETVDKKIAEDSKLLHTVSEELQQYIKDEESRETQVSEDKEPADDGIAEGNTEAMSQEPNQEEAANIMEDNDSIRVTEGTVQEHSSEQNPTSLFKSIRNWFSRLTKGTPDRHMPKNISNTEGWIPTSSRYPNQKECLENGGLFIVTDGNKEYVAKFGFDNVVSWKPLPNDYDIKTEETT